MTQEQQKKAFHQDIINLYKRIRKEVKYTPPQLFETINKYGGYEAVIKYIITDSNIFLFSLLWENERLDLSLEALVTNPKYKEIFPDDIVKYCDKRLKEYNYAPKKIEPENPVMDAFLTDFFDGVDEETFIRDNRKSDHDCYFVQNNITKEQWKDMLQDEKIFSSKNRDLVLRIYLMGSYDIPVDLLVQEEGYTKAYPYKEVITTLAKRIKSLLKIDMPKNTEGKMMPWHILFTGWFEDSKAFEISLQDALRAGIEELIAEEPAVAKAITVKNTVERKRMAPKAKALEVVQEVQEVQEVQAPVLDATTPKGEALVIDEIPSELNIPVARGIIPEVKMGETDKEGPIMKEPLGEKTLETVDETIAVSDKIKQLKEECLEYYGAVCDVCGFDYGYTYGEEYEQLIEVYPLQEGYILSESEIGDLNTVNPQKNLIPLCANCHKVLTTQKQLSVDALKKMIK